MTTQTIQVTFRTDETLKKEAEMLFTQMGLNMTTALNVFLRQAVLERAIPFQPKARTITHVPDFTRLSEEEKNSEIQKGFDSMKAGRMISSEQLRENLQRKYGI